MIDFMEIGSSPYEEDCAQVGEYNYSRKAYEECKRFVELLEKKFPGRPEGATFVIRSHPHDFGTYREVSVRYDCNSEEESYFAAFVESNTPATWDDDEVMEWRKDIMEDMKKEDENSFLGGVY